MIKQPKPRQKLVAFTLIELLVVMVIMGVVLAAATLSINMLSGNRQVSLVAAEVQESILTAQQQAILMPEVLSVKFTRRGYKFYRYVLGKKGFKWQVLPQDKLSHPDIFAKYGVAMRLIATTEKQFIISSSGDATPFTLILSDHKQVIQYQLKMQANGVLTLQPTKGIS